MSEGEFDWHAPQEGKDFTFIKEWPIYSLPITSILAPEAREIFKKYEAKRSAQLDELCEDVATMVQQSMLYDFDQSAVRGVRRTEEDRQHYAKTMTPQHPTLLGVCTEGTYLGLSLWKALGIKAEASYLATTTNTGLPHAVIRVTHDGRDRIINTTSGSMEFGLVRNDEELRRVGPPQKSDKALNVVYGNPDETVELKTNASHEVAVFHPDPLLVKSGKFTSDDYLANVNPKEQEDKTRPRFIKLLKFQPPEGVSPTISQIEPRQIWDSGIEEQKGIGIKRTGLIRRIPHE